MRHPMRYTLARHYHDSHMIELCFENKPNQWMLASVAHEDCFDTEVIDAIDQNGIYEFTIGDF